MAKGIPIILLKGIIISSFCISLGISTNVTGSSDINGITTQKSLETSNPAQAVMTEKTASSADNSNIVTDSNNKGLVTTEEIVTGLNNNGITTEKIVANSDNSGIVTTENAVKDSTVRDGITTENIVTSSSNVDIVTTTQSLETENPQTISENSTVTQEQTDDISTNIPYQGTSQNIQKDSDAPTSASFQSSTDSTSHQDVTPSSAENNRNASQCRNPETCVFEYIMKGYNRLIRPNKNPNDTTVIRLQLLMNSLLDISEKEEIMRVVGYFRAFWRDEVISWDPANFNGVKEIVVPADTIWVPDIGISNSVSSFYDISYRRDFHLRISYNGEIRWSFGGIFSTSCDIELNFYPFDFQDCPIEIESWQYTKNQVMLTYDPENFIDAESLESNPLWVLEKQHVEHIYKYDGEYSSIMFTLHWGRKSMYYYINILIPSMFMMIVTLGVFWLPAQCGEKMSLAITVLLAFSVFQIIIMEITPVNSDSVPVITKLVVLVMSLATTCLVSSMIVIYISDKNPEIRAPYYVRKVFLQILSRIMFMDVHKFHHDEKVSKPDNQATENGNNLKHSPGNNNVKSEGSCSLETPPGQQEKPGKWSSKKAKDKDVYKKYFVNEFTSPLPKKQPSSKSNSSLEVNETEFIEEEGASSNKNSNNNNTQDNRSSRSSVRNTKDVSKSDLKQVIEILMHMREYLDDKVQSDKVIEEWKDIGKVLDRLLFWIALIIMIVFLIYLFALQAYVD